MIDEGQLFNQTSLGAQHPAPSISSITSTRSKADKAAEIKRNSKEGTVDINLKLRRKRKTIDRLQGGVSGLAGSFIGLTYQTNNFLGLGETLTFSAQFAILRAASFSDLPEP